MTLMKATDHIIQYPISNSQSAVEERSQRAELWYWIGVLGIIAVALPLLTLRLADYPIPWFDEGLNMQPPKNLVTQGAYALRSGDALWVFDPAIQTGPTVLLPVALAFKLAGLSVLAARWVVVSFALLALIAFYQTTTRLFNRWAALVCLALLLTASRSQFLSFTLMSRQVLGEVPALLTLLAGAGLWFAAWQQPSAPPLNTPRLRGGLWGGVAAGCCFGLTIVTKVQFALILPPAILLTWLTSRRVLSLSKGRLADGRLGWRHLLLPLGAMTAVVAAWYAVQLVILGPATFVENISRLRQGTQIHILDLNLEKLALRASQLWPGGLLLLGLPGLVYGLVCDRTSASSVEPSRSVWLCRFFIAVLAMLWLVWYLFFSIGWTRYAFVPLTLLTPFAAALLARLADLLPGGRPGWRYASIAALVALFALFGLRLEADIANAPPDPGRQLAAFINAHVPSEAIIESWEWELDVWTDHIYHHPHYEVTNRLTQHVWNDTTHPSTLVGQVANLSYTDYPFLDLGPQYLINGPFSKWTGIYGPALAGDKFRLLASFRPYDLYQVIEP
jgi:hypothetical protein